MKRRNEAWCRMAAAQRSTSGIQVRHRRGLHVPEAGLWLDPPTRRHWALVTHAHSDHFARHETTVCSLPTAALIRARYGNPQDRELRALTYGETVKRNDFFIKLHPAGHILGSAMVHITREEDGASLLYTGDFKLRESPTCEAADPQPADILIMETTFGLPHYRFPRREEIREKVQAFVLETLEVGKVPVLLGYSLGKAQEILALIEGMGLPIMAHDSITKMTEVFRVLGRNLPQLLPLAPAQAAGHIVLAPPQKAKNLSALMPARTALLSGWALDQRAKYRYGVDEAFPLSDHADYAELLELVERVRPKIVYTVHGHTTEFAADLRRRGQEAWSLVKDDQRELALV